MSMRRLSERIASLGCTVLERMMSEISRFSAMSSLHGAPKLDQLDENCTDKVNSQAAARRLVDLLIQGAIGPRGPPSHHVCKCVPRRSDVKRSCRNSRNGEIIVYDVGCSPSLNVVFRSSNVECVAIVIARSTKKLRRLWTDLCCIWN